MRGDLNDSGISRDYQWRHYIVPASCALLIFGLHAIPGEDLPSSTMLDMLNADKLIHLVMFGVLSASVFVALGKSGSIRKYKWIAGGALLMYGIGLEFAQDIWFAGRFASIGDMLADGLGILAGRLAFRGVYGCWN